MLLNFAQDQCCDDEDNECESDTAQCVFPIGEPDSECCDKDYIVGPPGPPGGLGPVGPTGPAGPMGAPGAGGAQLVVSSTTTIPVSQLYTIVNATGTTTQTLPPISSVLLANIAVPYTVYNYGGTVITVTGTGGELINGDPTAELRFKYESVTFLPTPLGWVVI